MVNKVHKAPKSAANGQRGVWQAVEGLAPEAEQHDLLDLSRGERHLELRERHTCVKRRTRCDLRPGAAETNLRRKFAIRVCGYVG